MGKMVAASQRLVYPFTPTPTHVRTLALTHVLVTYTHTSTHALTESLTLVEPIRKAEWKKCLDTIFTWATCQS